MTIDLEQEGWALERASWNELQTLLDLLSQGIETTADWVELSVLHQAVHSEVLRRGCPACLQDALTGGPSDPDSLIDDPYGVGEPTVMLRHSYKSRTLSLPENTGTVYRLGCVLVCNACADTGTIDFRDVAFNDDHPLMGCSWRAAWSVCDQVMASDGGRTVPFYDQTLAEVIARVRAADDWNDDSVDVSNFHARISVSVAPIPGGNPASDDLSEVSLLGKMTPAFFHLLAEGIDVEALREPATAWLRAADVMGTSQRVGDILTQVADAVRHEDLHFLQDDLAVVLHSLLRETTEAVKCLQALTADTLTLTPEAHYNRFGFA